MTKNTIDEIIVKLLRDNEKLKEPVTEDIEVFSSIEVVEQLHVAVSETLSDPVEVTSIVDTDRVGFCEVVE